ncbi:MAG: hypothetical protein Q4E35_07235 [Eubacteriales bacterium]|nr:hypothetical protein [Eubacteriales bacterium]
MAGKSCFLIGHREICGNISQILETEIEKHITQYGVNEFIVGGYGEFDRLAASVLFRVRQRYPSIRILLLLPYFPIPNLKEKAKGFDDTFFPPGMEKVPRRYAIVRANRYVTDHVDYLIAYVWHPASNARELVEYAQRRKANGYIKVTKINQQ